MPLLLASPAIPPGGEIPSQYTCDGADISPPLTWSGVPNGTKSLVLVVEDPDAPSGDPAIGLFSTFPAVHTVSTLVIPQNRPAKGLNEVHNDFGKPGYGGRCPLRGHATHHYHFRLLAISRPILDLKQAASASDVLKTSKSYAIQRAELVGTFQR
jgi:Raf kinase inhibitor-like YbhB/YbcL family protein